MIKTSPLADIRIDGETQPRSEINTEVVAEYAEAMAGGDKFPPVIVFYDGVDYWLVDGFHRVHVTREAGRDKIQCEVHDGTIEEARWFSYRVNRTHGIRRTNDDKRKAVKAALLHPNGAKMSDRKIAEHVGVGHVMVSRIRHELETTVSLEQSAERTGQDGRTINTANIGKTGPPVKEEFLPNPRTKHIFDHADADYEYVEVCEGEEAPEGYEYVEAGENEVEVTSTHGIPDYEHTKLYAKNCADCAITQLERIPGDNPGREVAFEKVEKWIVSQGGSLYPPGSPHKGKFRGINDETTRLFEIVDKALAHWPERYAGQAEEILASYTKERIITCIQKQSKQK